MNNILQNAFNILALDAIYQVLDWKDRIRLHLAANERMELEPTPAIKAAHEYITRNHWIAPENRYLKDQEGLHCYYSGRWMSVEDFRKMKPLKIK